MGVHFGLKRITQEAAGRCETVLLCVVLVYMLYSARVYKIHQPFCFQCAHTVSLYILEVTPICLDHFGPDFERLGQ